MVRNLPKAEAQRLRDKKDFADAIWGIAIFLLFICSVIYIGYRVGNMQPEQPKITKNPR